MLYRDKESLKIDHQFAFLDWIDQIAPEVKKDLRGMVRLRNKVYRSEIVTLYELEGYIEIFCSDVDPCNYFHDPNGDLNQDKIDGIFTSSRRNTKTAPGERTFLSILNKLRDQFLLFVKRYSLNKDWLKSYMFDLLNCYAAGGKYVRQTSSNISFGDPFVFRANETWKVGEDSTVFIKRVKRQFKDGLNRYVDRTAKQFHNDGLQKVTRPFDVDAVKWLVYFTVKGLRKYEIVDLINAERTEREGKSVWIDESTLDKLLNRLKIYDLPMRE